MAGSINKVILIGRVGQAPEIRYTSGGTPVAHFSVATDESFKNRSGEQQQHTEWHRIVAWNRLAEICGEYLTKGKQVYIEGSIRSNQWEDKSGSKRTTYEIIANTMKMLGSRSDSERPASGAPRPAASQAPPSEERYDSGPEPSPEGEITDDDIPF